MRRLSIMPWCRFAVAVNACRVVMLKAPVTPVALLLTASCGMTESRLDVLPPTPLLAPRIAQAPVDADAVAKRLRELYTEVVPSANNEGATGQQSVPTSRVTLNPHDEELVQSLALSLEREGLHLVGRVPVEDPPPASGLPAQLPVQNVAVLGFSNYRGFLQQRDPVESQLLQFASDSVELTGAHQRFLRKIAWYFDNSTDLISVLGCSNGATRLPNGNAALALGRAHSVRQQLLTGGIPPERILTEGCWSEKRRTDKLPNRGVLVTLYR